MNSFLEKVFDALQPNLPLPDVEGWITTVKLGEQEFEIHPTFVKAFLEGWENTSQYLRLSGSTSWGDFTGYSRIK